MPNETSLGINARCTTLYCDNLVQEHPSGIITANDIQTNTLEVASTSTTNGILNTGTITTGTLVATNVYSTNINKVYFDSESLNSGVVLTSNDFNADYNHYRCIVSLTNIDTPTTLGSVFLYLNHTTDADVNQFVYTTSFFEGSSATTTNNGYYPFLISWVNAAVGYREDGEYVLVFDILNTQVIGRAAEIKSYNLSYSAQNTPGLLAPPGVSLGNLINNGYSYGTGPTPGVIGTQLSGEFKGCTVKFQYGFASSGTASLEIYGYN